LVPGHLNSHAFIGMQSATTAMTATSGHATDSIKSMASVLKTGVAVKPKV
jgi:hypothetical protein